MATATRIRIEPMEADFLEFEDGAAASAEAALAELRGLDAFDRLLALYEFGIEACAQGDGPRVSAALLELIGIIDFQYGDIAEGFYRLYNYCLQKTRDGEFDRVAWILSGLRETSLSSQTAQATTS